LSHLSEQLNAVRMWSGIPKKDRISGPNPDTIPEENEYQAIPKIAKPRARDLGSSLVNLPSAVKN
jgi:hypothetical protein